MLKDAQPIMKLFGITDQHLEVFMKLPQILDGIANRIIQIEQHLTVPQGKRAAPLGQPIPPAPEAGSSSPPQGTLQGPAPPGGGWLQGFLKSPKGQEFALTLAKAFTGEGTLESGSAEAAVAKEIVKGIRAKAIDEVQKAFKIRPEFKKEVEARKT